MPEKEVISKLLQLTRKNPPKTQAACAAELRICRKELSMLELQVANPSYATLKKIADYYDLTVPQLLWVNSYACPPGRGAFSEKALGQHVRAYRKEHKLSQEKFAALAEISVSQLSQIERGLTIPCLNTLQAFANCIGITVAELFIPILKEGDV